MRASRDGNGGKGGECSKIKVGVREMYIGHIIIVCADLCEYQWNTQDQRPKTKNQKPRY